MKMDGTLIKRIVALMLTLTLVFGSVDMIPGLAAARAEEEETAVHQAAEAQPETEEQASAPESAGAAAELPETASDAEAAPVQEEASETGEEPGLQPLPEREAPFHVAMVATASAVTEEAPAAEEAVEEEAAPVEDAPEAPAAEEAAEEEAAPVEEASEAPAAEEAVEEEAAPVEEASEAPAAEEAVEEEAAPVEDAPEAPAAEEAVEEEAAPVEEASEAPAAEEAAEEEAAPVEEAVEEEAAPLEDAPEADAAEEAEADETADPEEPDLSDEETESEDELVLSVISLRSDAPEADAAEKEVADETADPENPDILNEETESEDELVLSVMNLRSDAPATLRTAKAADEDKTAALQQMIADKIKAEGLNKRIAITVSKDTEYEGDVTIEKEEGKTYGEDFGIDLIAEDAGEDHLQSEGTSVVKGSITIKGIDVRMMGIVVAAGSKVTVEDAKLDYYGTKNDDAITVETGDKAEAVIVTGEGGDNVTVNAKGGETTVVTGEGGDTVTVNAEGGKTDVNTGDGDDTVKAEVSGKAEVTIETGDGDDNLSLNASGGKTAADTGLGNDQVQTVLSGEAEAKIETGEGDDTVAVTDSSVKNVAVETGEGDDTVTLDARPGAGTVEISTGDGNDTVAVGSQSKEPAANPMGQVNVDLGSGIDQATVDLSVSGAAKTVSVAGGADSDQLHIIGSLDSDTNERDRAKGNETNMTLAAENKKTLNITTKDVESITDELKNKRTVKLTPAASGEIANYVAEMPFTDYLVTAPSSALKNIVVTTRNGRALALSNLIISTDTTWDGENKLVVSDGTVISAKGLKLVMKARNIEVNGVLQADLVQLEALDGTGMYNRNFKDQYAAYKDVIEVPGVSQAGAAITAAADLAYDLINVKDNATIVIGEKAAVYSSGDVILLARVEQEGGMISLLPNVNLVNVKIAKASVEIAGKIYAGYDFTKNQTRTDRGAVKADAQVKTTIGDKVKGIDEVIAMPMPLAVSVAKTEAVISVKPSAVIEAAKDISLNAQSQLKATTKADSGLFGLPASVAVAVLLNDAHTSVDGTLTSKNGSITVTAKGDLEAATVAEKGQGHESISGGYAAVTVALQDVKAELASKAAVNAKGNVQVMSAANEKVENRASSSAPSQSGSANTEGDITTIILGFVQNTIWPKIKQSISSESDAEKMEKAMKKVVNSNHSVKLDEDAQKKGEVKVTIDESKTTDNSVTGKVEVTPWPGYKVKSITWRGYNPGDDHWTAGKIETANGAFVFKVQNVTVFVEYEEDENYDEDLSDTASDLFGEKEETEEVDLQKLLDDVQNDTGDSGKELDDLLKEIEENTKYVPLKLEGSGGAVLTYETKDGEPTKSLDQAVLGEELRLVPNPAAGKKLADGGLKVTYKVEEDGKEVTKKAVVNKDAQGRYIFKVPENIKLKDADGKDLNLLVTAEFVDDGNQSVKADETQTQLTGTIAVAVTSNDGQALIDTGAQVTAGGKAETASTGKTNITNVASGASVSKEETAAAKKSDDLAIKRPEAATVNTFDEAPKYGLLLDAMENGAVAAERVEGSGKAYTYSFTASPAEGYSVSSALLVYYSGSERKTAELKLGADGKYTVDLTDKEFSVDEGSTVQVSFSFAKEGEYGKTVSTQAAQVLIPNPISISYNALKDQNNKEATVKIGSIYYQDAKAEKDENGKITAYAFKADPKTDGGYMLDGKLKATWKDANGNEQSRELEEKDGYWYLKAEGIPAGSPIKVTGAFKEDLHAFEVNKDATKNGAVTLHDEKVKKDDTPKITVKPNPGYSVQDIIITYTENGKGKTIKLSDANSKLTQAKDDKGNAIEGVYTFTVPGISPDSKISVSASFKLKTIGLFAGATDSDKDYTLSEKNVAAGDKVTATINSDKAAQGYKIAKLTVKDSAGKTVAESADGSFTVPKNTEEGAKLTVSVELAQKEIAVSGGKLEHGSVSAKTARADRGELVTVAVNPDKDFKAKAGTLKAIVKSNDGTYSEEVFMARKDDTTYTFIVPSDIEDPAKVSISFVGEFEPGQSDSSSVNTSLGAGIAVTVASGESRADVKGAVTSGSSVIVSSSMEGGVKTETAAGYSKGNIGVGGAVSVQVASLDSKALVHQSADLKLNGQLKVSAESDVAFTVNADASGSKEAKKAGVGAGIAVAVNGGDTFAAVQDGAKLSANGSAIKSVAITANQKVKDAVSAKAGAAGGTAVVPVAAVNVIGTGAEASMGKTSAGMLALTEGMAVSAANDASHTISADASASGKGVGVGAAISVSVISDTANAKLKQSTDAVEITVTTETVSSVTETSTASASGGKSEGKSADGQTDGLLGTASKLAGKNKSQSSVSTAKIKNATEKRQKGETSEGTVGVAGAVAVNVQDSRSASEVLGGVSLKAAGLVAVTAQNATIAKVTANGSTTNSDIGVGVGVAVNVVGLQNIASIGDGEIEAAMLRVAALTKVKEPEKKEEVKKETAEDKKGLENEIGEAVTGYIADLIKEMGLDSYVSADLISKIAGDVAASASKELIKATGLNEFLGDGTFSEKYDAAVKLLSDAKDGLLALPEALIQPFTEALDEVVDLGGLTEKQLSTLKNTLKDTFLNELQKQLSTVGSDIVASVKDGMLEYLSDNVGDIFSGVLSGDFSKEFGKVFGEAADQIGKAVNKELKKVVSETFRNTLQNVSIPGLNGQNADRVVRAFEALKDAYKKESLESIFDSAVSYVTSTFKTKVFDYEAMIVKLSQKDFKKEITDGLRNAAKAAMVTLTNEAIGALTDHFDLVLEAKEAKATGHVIETQAIAGAGAREVGVAGSVAITVLNADTTAKIADGGKVKVTGEMTVDAKELRTVRNVGSAAVDAKGNAASNKSAKDSANANVSGNTTVGNDTVTLTLGAGAQASIRQGDMADKQPKIYVTLNPGYKLPEGNKASFSYTDTTGMTKMGEVELTEEDGKWVLDTKSGDLASASIDFAKGIKLELKPVESLHGVAKPTVDMSQVDLEAGAVNVSVKGRDVEKGEDGQEKLSAKQGDTVEIKIAKGAGRKVSWVGYSWKDAQGKVHDVEMNTEKDKDRVKEFTLVSSNEKELIYTFNMPDGDITDILVVFEKGEDTTEESKTTAKDSTGKSVGVGAAFSLVYGDVNVNSSIGNRANGVSAGSLSMTADSDHKEDIASAAGTDPLAGDSNPDDTKKYSVDASVALNILDTAVKAVIDARTEVNTAGFTKDGEKNEGNLQLNAHENGVTKTTSSAFAVGGSVAVGASVAVNIASSAVTAEMAGSASVAGSAEITAFSHSEDDTHAIATAMGADIARSLKKLGEKTDQLEKKTNKLLDGSYVDNIGKDDQKNTTKTGDMINSKLDSKKKDDAKSASSSNSLSSNVLRTQDVSVQGDDTGKEATEEAHDQILDKTNVDLDLGNKKKDSKWQVAAAVGVTVADHAATATVGKVVAGKNIKAAAENTGNFNTMGTGASMSFAEHSNSIAAGVAVSVNHNKANTYGKGDLISLNQGDVAVTSRLTQNMDGDYRGKLAAQALSGSVSGRHSTVSIAGAISFVWSDAESTVDIAGGAAKTNRNITGGGITVEATDKSKLTARAGGINLSGGSSFGMGLSAATVVSLNDVSATLGDNANVKGASFTLNAEKQAITQDDYKNLIDMRYLVTDSSKLSEEERKNANTGLIDLHKGENDSSYTMKVNLSSEKLLQAVDALNFLSAQNTYVEAITGSVMYGEGTTNLAGSFAVAVQDNNVQAILGKNAKVELTKDETHSGEMTVNAENGSTARIIAGSLSAAPAKVSVGATVAVLVDNDNVKAETGADAVISAAGDFTQKAETTGDIQVFTAAMAVAAGVKAGTAAGGAVNVIVTKNTSESKLGDGVSITSGGSAAVEGKTTMDLMAISGSANVSAGAGSGVAAGGTINVIYDRAKSYATLGDSVGIEAAENVTVASDVSDQLISGVASASVAASLGNGKAGAGVVNVIIGKSAAHTKAGASLNLNAKGGDLKVNANNDAWLLNAGLSLSASSGLALGGAFNVNVLGREAKVDMNGGAMNAAGNLYAQATGKDTKILAGLAAAGGITGSAVGGTIGVLVENSVISTVVKKDTAMTATAGKSALIESYYSDYLIDAAGSIAASLASNAVGVTSVTVVKSNTVLTDLANSSVTAGVADEVEAKSGEKVNGVYVGANAKETQFIGGAGVAVAGGSTLNGIVTVLVNKNQVKADASKATIRTGKGVGRVPWNRLTIYKVVADYGEWGKRGEPISMDQVTEEDLRSGKIFYEYYNDSGWLEQRFATSFDDFYTDGMVYGDAKVQAHDDTTQLLLAGGLSASAGASGGAAIVTVVSNKNVEALANSINAGGNVTVSAENKDDIKQLAFSAGLSGGSGANIGAAVQVLRSKANAQVFGAVTSENGGFSLNSQNDTVLYNVGAAIAGAGGAAVTPVGVVTYFQGESNALLMAGSSVDVNKDINIIATGNKDINLYSVGAAIGGGIGLSGTANVLVSKDQTKASVESVEKDDVILKTSGGSLNVNADSDYKLRAASGALAAGSVGVAVNAVVSVMKSSTTASLGGAVTVTNGKVNVNAQGKRDVIDAAATLAGGAAGVGVTVMVLSAGAAMSQDAHDMLVYGNSETKDDDHKTFDVKKFMAASDKGGGYQYYDEVETDENGNAVRDEKGNVKRVKGSETLADSLTADLAGNNHRESEQQVGSKDEKGNSTFDASSKYRDKDVDNQSFDNDSEKGRGENLKTYIYVDKDGKEVDLNEVPHPEDEPDKYKQVDNSDTADVTKAKAVNTYSYHDPEDAVIARITPTAVVSAKQVTVEAKQPAAIDLIGASVGAGTAGVGVSAAVAILHSNVSASSVGEINGASDGIVISAQSISGTFEEDKDAEARNEAVADYMSNKPTNENDLTDEEKADPKKKEAALKAQREKNAKDKASIQDELLEKAKNRSIRVFGLAVGAGFVGVSVSASVALTDNTTQAILGGKVTGAGDVIVDAQHNYGSVMAANGALAGGVVGAGASVAVAQANGKVKALIERDAYVETNEDKKVRLTTDSNVGVDALALTVGGGLVAVNAGVALAFNRLEQETGVLPNAEVHSGGDVDIKAKSTTSSNTYLLGVSVGAVGVNLNAAVSDVAAKINTHIGDSMASRVGDPDEMPIAKVSGKNVNILNEISSSAIPKVMSVAAGGVAVGGNLLLAFNETEAVAMIDNGDVNGTKLNMTSNLTGTATSSLTAAQVGAVAVGVSVNYADMRAYNSSIIRNSAVKMTDSAFIGTNTGNQKTSAEAHTVSANMGAITVGMNAAIARNNARNYATIIGDGSRIMDFNKLEMHGKGESSATADIEGISFSAIDVAASTVVALNDADARTTVLVTKLKDGEYTDDESAKDRRNLLAVEGLTFNATQTGATTAKVTTGGGSLIGAKLSVGLAYGRTASVVDVVIHGGGEYAYVNSTNKASDTTISEINNSSFSVISAAARYGAAYSQDVYSSKVQLTGGNYLIHGNVDMKTDYDVKNIATVTPSTSGLDISLGSLSVNAAVARNTAYAGTEFEKSIGDTAKVDGSVNILTQGSSIAEAKVLTAALTASAIGMGANIAKADLSTTQAASFRVGGDLEIAGALSVKSVIKTDPTGKDVLSRAVAQISPMASEDAYEIALGTFKVSKAVARQNMRNTAALVGGAYKTEKVWAEVDKGQFVTKEVEDYDYEVIESVNYKLTNSGFEVKNFKDSDFNLMKKIYGHYNLKGYYLEYNTKDRQDAVLHMLYLKRNASKAVGNMQKYVRGDMNGKIQMLPEWVWWMLNTEDGHFFYDHQDDFFAAIVAYNGLVQGNENQNGEEESDDHFKQRVWDSIKDFTPEELEDIAYQLAFNYAAQYQLFDWEETPNYKKAIVAKSVWEEKPELMEVEKALYKTSENRLTAATIDVYAASGTRAEARTDGAKTFGGVVAGSLITDSLSADSVSALVEGMWPTAKHDFTVKAIANTKSDAIGSKPGGVSAVDLGTSDVKARVGEGSNAQTVAVVFGEDMRLYSSEGMLDVEAINRGSAESTLVEGTSVTLGKIKSTSIPTESVYSTLISFGKGADINGKLGVTIKSLDEPTAKSNVTSSSIGLGMNFNTMMGKNLIKQENNIDLGVGAELYSASGPITVEALQRTLADAQTTNNGGSLIEGSNAQAYNTIERHVRVNLREADILAFNPEGQVTVRAVSGEGDKIFTQAYTDSFGLASVAKATAIANVKSDAELILGMGAKVRGTKGTTLEAVATSYESMGGYDNKPGIETIGKVDALGVVAVPNGVARNNLTFNTYIQINDNKQTGVWTSNTVGDNSGPTRILANNEGLTAKTYALSKGKGGFGVSNATSWNEVVLVNAIWINATDIFTDYSHRENSEITIKATNGDAGNKATHIIADAHAALKGIAGKVAPTSRITGTQVNQVRSDDISRVKFHYADGVDPIHSATNPKDVIRIDAHPTYDRNEIKINLGFTKITITLTVAHVVRDLQWYIYDRCDFCKSGQEVDVRPSAQDTIEERWKKAYENALLPIEVVRAMAKALAGDPNAEIGARLARGLLPLTYLDTLVTRPSVVMKARYGVEDSKEITDLYVLDVENTLSKDVRLSEKDMERYLIWTNSATQSDVYLLPNATRVIVGTDGRVKYVSDVFTGSNEEGASFEMDMITAFAGGDPVIPIGRDGMLNFASSVFTIPQKTEITLYLHEISAKWLVDSMNSGFIRTLMATPEVAHNFYYVDGTSPSGEIVEGLIEAEEQYGVKLYWIGRAPDEATDAEEPLLYMLVNTETDQAKVYRITVGMMERGEDPTPMGLFLYRDSRSDRMEVEKYNVIFFDTTPDEEDIVRIITDVMPERNLEMPRPLRIVLRGFQLEGVDQPVYSIGNHIMALTNVKDGQANLLGSFYNAVFDTNTFESDFVRVEGISDGELAVLIKAGQPVWPEWTGANTARDIGGALYTFNDNQAE